MATTDHGIERLLQEMLDIHGMPNITPSPFRGESELGDCRLEQHTRAALSCAARGDLGAVHEHLKQILHIHVQRNAAHPTALPIRSQPAATVTDDLDNWALQKRAWIAFLGARYMRPRIGFAASPVEAA